MRLKTQHTEFNSNEAVVGASETSQTLTSVTTSRPQPPIVDPGWMHDANESVVTVEASVASSPVCLTHGSAPLSDSTAKGCTKPVNHLSDGEAGVSTGEGGWYPPAVEETLPTRGHTKLLGSRT